MGIFDKNLDKSSDNLYEDVRKYLKPRNGKKQVVLINTMSKMATNGLECDNKYTLQISGVLDEMQNDGYEIIDVKIETLPSSVGAAALIRTLVIYK